MVRSAMVLLLLSLAGCKPTCPAGDVACLVATLNLRDVSADFTAEGAKLKLTDVPTEILIAAQAGTTADGGSKANRALDFTTVSAPTFDTNVDYGLVFFTFADPLGCRPAVCFTPCPKNAKCLGTSRCTPPLRDGLTSGSGWFRAEFASQPAEPTDFSYSITPVAAEGCPADVLTRLEAGESVSVGFSDRVAILLPGPGATSGSGGGAGGSGGGGGATSSCTVTREQCCMNGASLCGVSPGACDACPAGTQRGVICAAGSPCNTTGGITAGSRICHCN